MDHTRQIRFHFNSTEPEIFIHLYILTNNRLMITSNSVDIKCLRQSIQMFINHEFIKKL